MLIFESNLEKCKPFERIRRKSFAGSDIMKINTLVLSVSIISMFLWVSRTAAEILFEEKFEDTSFASRGWYDGPRGTLSDIEHLSGSDYSFECKFQQGETGCNGGTPGRHLF